MGIYPGGKEHILIRVRKSDLMKLFGISKHTLNKWHQKGELNIRNLRSICDLFLAREGKK